MNKVFILTGPVQTGKTTKLMQWAVTQKNIDGIFQPIIEGKRFIYHVGSRTLKRLETNDSTNSTTIGNYKFSNEVFYWAQTTLLDCIDKNPDWLVIDEIGPLELEGKGLEPAITKIFFELEKLNGNILCVVRKTILEKFVEHYKLKSIYNLFEFPS